MALTLTESAPRHPENPRPANQPPRPENRVWGLRQKPNKTRPANAPQPKQPRRETAPCAHETAPGVRFYHKNHLDHVYAVSDSDGNVLERYRYSPFGQIEIYSPTGTYLGNSTKNSAIGNTRTWNTRILDPDTNLYMYKYRHYHAGLGRFMSRDPIGEAGGPNLYAFVHNNPVNAWDQLGLIWVLTGVNGQKMTQQECNDYCFKECKSFGVPSKGGTITERVHVSYPSPNKKTETTIYRCGCDCDGEVTEDVMRSLIILHGITISPDGRVVLRDPKNWTTRTVRDKKTGKVLSRELISKIGRCTLFTDFNHGAGIRPHMDLNIDGTRYRLFLACRSSTFNARVFKKRFCKHPKY